MKSVKRIKRKLVVCMAIVAALVIGVVTPSIVKKVNAATPGVFTEYDKNMAKKFGIEEAGYGSTQGMSIYGDFAFYAKMVNIGKNDSKEQKAKKKDLVRIWAYNLKTGKKYPVYNKDTTNQNFLLAHANCLFVNGNYLYVATCNPEWPISRYNLHIGNGKIYLTDRINYTLSGQINGDKAYGIEYAGSMNQFLVRGKYVIYAGHFENNEFKCEKTYKIGTEVTINGNEEDISLRDDDKGYTHQGIYYKDGYVYLPMIKNVKQNETHTADQKQSLVVAFALDSSTPDGFTLEANNDMVVNIVSKDFPNLFEIEAVGCYKGEMYIATNVRVKEGVGGDFISKIVGFEF